MLRVPDDADSDLAALEALGFPRKRVPQTGGVAELGPRSGLSDAQRLLRALNMGVCTAEQLLSGDFPRKKRKRDEAATEGCGLYAVPFRFPASPPKKTNLYPPGLVVPEGRWVETHLRDQFGNEREFTEVRVE